MTYEIRYIGPGDVRLYENGDMIGQFETEVDALTHQRIVEADHSAALVEILNSQAKLIATLGDCLRQIADLSTGWKHGNEGVHLLRIQDLVKPFLPHEENQNDD